MTSEPIRIYRDSCRVRNAQMIQQPPEESPEVWQSVRLKYPKHQKVHCVKNWNCISRKVMVNRLVSLFFVLKLFRINLRNTWSTLWSRTFCCYCDDRLLLQTIYNHVSIQYLFVIFLSTYIVMKFSAVNIIVNVILYRSPMKENSWAFKVPKKTNVLQNISSKKLG